MSSYSSMYCCLVDNFVREVIKCSCCMRWRFDIWQFSQVAQLRILNVIRTWSAIRPQMVAHFHPWEVWKKMTGG